VALRLHLERMEVDVYEDVLKKLLHVPADNISKFFKEMFGPLGLDISIQSEYYKKNVSETEINYLQILTEKKT